MKCNSQLLSEYFDGELLPEQRALVEAHLRECDVCASVLADYRRMSHAIKGLHPQMAPASLESDLEQRVSRSYGLGRWGRFVAPLLERAAIVVATAAIVIVAGGALRGVGLDTSQSLIAATPSVFADEISANMTIKVTFDRSMDRSSVESALSITPPLKTDYLWRGDDLYLVPKEPLRSGTTYRIAVDESAKDGQGQSLQSPIALEFATTSQVIEPESSPTPATRVTESATKLPTMVAQEQRTPVTGTPATSIVSTPRAILTAEASMTVVIPKATGTVSTQPTPGATAPVQNATPTAMAPTGKAVIIAANSQITSTAAISATADITVTRDFGSAYERNPEVRKRLGDPLDNERGVLVAEQSFERGLMLWQLDKKTIYVLNKDGTWSTHSDLWQDGDPELSGLPVPPDKYQPTRGFGKVWSESEESKTKLGWGTEKEHGFVGTIQEFVKGTMFLDDQHTVYVLYADGTWESVVGGSQGQ